MHRPAPGTAALAPPRHAHVLLGRRRLVVSEPAGGDDAGGPHAGQQVSPDDSPALGLLRRLDRLPRRRGVHREGQLPLVGPRRQARAVLADPVEQLGVAGHPRRLVVEADHEVVLGPGGGHVQQPTLLRLLEAPILLAPRRVPLGLEVPVVLVTEPDLGPRTTPRHDRVPLIAVGVEARQHDHRELEALGPVHGHDAHSVVVGLGGDRLDPIGSTVGLRGDPGHELGQRGAADLHETPGGIGQEAVPPPVVPGPAVGQGELDHSSIPHHPGDELAHGQPVACLVQ